MADEETSGEPKNETARQGRPSMNDIMEIVSKWAVETAVGGVPLEVTGTFTAEVGYSLLRGSRGADATPEVLLDWAIVKVGAGQVAVPLLHHLRQHPAALVATLTPIPDVIEVVALTLASAGVSAAFDICADALYRAAGGTPSADGRYKDLGYWRKPERRAKDLKRFPASRQWLENLLASPELTRVEDARHALIHRHVARRVVKALVATDDGHGSHRIEQRFPASTVLVPQAPGGRPKELGRVDDIVAEALAFGEREVLSCRAAMRRDGMVPM
ncbi:MAG TPA: hypothetical protein VH661_09690 [Candidatus Dormibacteraeota bacterium]|nr:hypothetical protein [Candidatus Dormibacteraeota bacterium]